MQSSPRGLELAESAMPQRTARILLIVGAILIVILAWAWIGGGREPLHEIVEPVAVPDSAR